MAKLLGSELTVASATNTQGESGHPTALKPGEANLWCDTAELANIAGISRQKTHAAIVRCLNGGMWRSVELQVRWIEGSGGQGNKALQVFVPSLPANLRTIWHKRNPGALTAPAVVPTQVSAPATIDVGIGNRVAEMQWKLAIVAPALAHPKGSRARAAVLKDIAAREHPGLNGKPVQIAVDTLRDWLSKIHDGNETALARPRRADAGKPRYFVNAEWDKACPLPDTQKLPISTAIETFIRGLWREGSDSERKINALASAELQTISHAAGWQDAPLIPPGLHLVRKLSPSRLVGIKEKDAKLYHDKYTPRIHRKRPECPMDIVIGDVHPVDVSLRREDGSEGTARMIAWLDLANNDLFYTLVLLPKGKGITQAHIAASFVEMVQAWGMPRTLYLDNGSEYQWEEMMAGFRKLQGLREGFQAFIANATEIDSAAGMGEDKEAPRALVRAKPYNAQAKAIEGVFSCLEKFIALIPGYIGGNRMKKKTHNVGKAPASFPGTFEEFRDTAFAEAVDFYRNAPQRGTMGDQSVNEKKRGQYSSGWEPVRPSRETFLFAFATPYSVRVNTGGIKIENEWFNCDALIPEIGTKIEVLYAKWDGNFALWINSESKPVLIHKETHYHPLDIAGAKEQSRRNGIQTANVAALRKLSPHVDTIAAMARYNAALPAPPVTPAGLKITFEPEARALGDAIREGANAALVPPSKRLRPGELIHPKTGEVMSMNAQPARSDVTLSLPPPKMKRSETAPTVPDLDNALLATFRQSPKSTEKT